MSGRVGGEDESVGIVVWGFAVEVEDTPVAVSTNYQHSIMTSGRIQASVKGSPGHLPAPFALSQGLGGDTAAMPRGVDL